MGALGLTELAFDASVRADDAHPDSVDARGELECGRANAHAARRVGRLDRAHVDDAHRVNACERAPKLRAHARARGAR